MYKLFNDGWEYQLRPVGEKPSESGYEKVDIPHDRQIFHAKDLYSDGDAFYRKRFDAGKVSGKVFFLRFEGVYMDSDIYLNGEKIFEWKYGYTQFDCPLENIRDGENEIVVRVRYQNPNTRWYSGSGIYRSVWLRETGKNRLAADANYVVSYIEGETWKTEIDTEVECDCAGTIRHTLFDADGEAVLTSKMPFPEGTKKVSQSFEIDSPNLWSVDSPYLYSLLTELVVGKEVVDSSFERIGYKYVRFDPNNGFFLNGKNIKLNGVCMHHDLGALGSAVNRTATRRQLEILKEMGVNAIRTSHNPPSVEMMDLCDEMGFLVDSEILDMWESKKTDFDYARFFADWHEKDVRSWIRRDRNRASIIMWSLGNEISDTNFPRGVEVTEELARCVRIDDYKCAHPVTVGSNYMRWEGAQKCAEKLGTVGYNYSEDIYDEHHAARPSWIIYGSETASTIHSRGIYHFPASVSATTFDDEQCSSLLNCATGWGAPNPEYNILEDKKRKFSLGQFVWTGFDYIGEPTPYRTKNSYFGHVDTAGFPKDSFYAYKAEWNKNAEPFVHLFPYWDFNEGQLVDVFIFSNCKKTELFVNGKSQGVYVSESESGKLSGRWRVPYHRGEIKAVGYDETNKKVCEHTRRSFSDSAEIILKPDKTTLFANGEDMIFVEVSTADRDGNPVENARDRINVSLSGAGRLVGLDNGDSTDYEEYKSTSRRLFSGKLLVMIAAKTEPGDIELKVMAPSLPEKRLKLRAIEARKIEGGSFDYEIENEPLKNDVSVRKIELTVPTQIITPEAGEVEVGAKILPENADYKDIGFKAVTDLGVETNLLEIEKTQTGARLIPRGDGEYRLRAFCKNGGKYEEILSEIEMKNEGFGPASFDPYGEILHASLCSNTKEFLGIMEGGVLVHAGDIVKFDRVDFGKIGSDTVEIGIYTYNENEIPVELSDGCGNVISTLKFKAKNEWNTYKYNTFKLPEKLKGVKSIAFKFDQELRFKGFKFANPRRLGEKIYALENDGVYGDSFDIGEKMIEKIGNNVSIIFEGVDLGEGASEIEISGRTRNASDVVHLRFDNGEARKAEFEGSEDVVARRFKIEPVSGVRDLSVLFLPGCDFDLEYVKFIK